MGFRGRHKNKRDANEPAIKSVLELHGFSVRAIDVPCDLIAGRDGFNYLIEVKAPRGHLTPSQKEFVKQWRGQWVTLRSAEEADAWAQATRRTFPGDGDNFKTLGEV